MRSPSSLDPWESPPAPRAWRIFSGWSRFWFTPVNPVGLHWLRVSASLLFILWLLPLAGNVEAFFGLDGWFDQEAYLQARQIPNGPYFGWSLLYVAGTNAALLKGMYWGALAIFALFGLGICVRLTAVLSWVMVASFLASPAVGYDADTLLVLLAFYLMLGYLFLGQWSRPQSMLERILGPNDVGILSWFRGKPARNATPSYGANLALRLLQIHFAVVVVISGLHKLQFGDWWSGVAFWYPSHPPFETTAATIQAEIAAGSTRSHLFLLSLSGYVVLAWQLGFPLFAWKRNWRLLLLGGAVIGWAGSMFLYRLPLFGPAYVLGCLSFVSAEEWLGSFGRKTRLLGGSKRAEPTERQKFQPRVH